MTRHRSRGLLALLLGALLAALLLSGCGAATPAAAASPLALRLEQIDLSLEDGRFAQARRDLSALATETKAARASGELGAARADQILAAIAALTATLPAPTPTATATPTPTPAPVAPAPQPAEQDSGKADKAGDKGSEKSDDKSDDKGSDKGGKGKNKDD